MQFLVLARVAEGISLEQVMPHVKAEAEIIWKQYAAGVARSIYYIADMSGAVLLCEAADLEAAQEMTNQLPMVKAELLKVEILPLKPYTGLEALFDRSAVNV
jgi:uncharacterized protein YciI